MNWIKDNAAALVAAAGALYTLLSVINGMMKDSPAKTIMGDVLDILSYISRLDAAGSVKLPGRRSSSAEPPAAGSGGGGSSGLLYIHDAFDPQHRKPPIHASVALLFALGLASCAHLKAGGAALGQCELNQLPQAMQTAVAQVTSYLVSGDDWQSELEQLALKLGGAQVSCLVQAVEAGLKASIQPHALPAISTIAAIQRAEIWLKSHPVAK